MDKVELTNIQLLTADTAKNELNVIIQLSYKVNSETGESIVNYELPLPFKKNELPSVVDFTGLESTDMYDNREGSKVKYKKYVNATLNTGIKVKRLYLIRSDRVKKPVRVKL